MVCSLLQVVVSEAIRVIVSEAIFVYLQHRWLGHYIRRRGLVGAAQLLLPFTCAGSPEVVMYVEKFPVLL